MAADNPNVILCERGIRTFTLQYTRNTLDMYAISVLRSLIYLPIMFDLSHATDFLEFVPMMPMAAITFGTDSLMIKVYPKPAKALSDGTLTLEGFEQLLMQEMAVLCQFFGRWTQNHNTTATPKLAPIPSTAHT